MTAFALAATGLAAAPAATATAAGDRWVAIWTSMPQLTETSTLPGRTDLGTSRLLRSRILGGLINEYRHAV
ncbi:hypothetical protein ILP97_57075 [Amycolatopsis sp. H6(2020)]|nr:hypothetical protein [Amycolatopsis sp. H6(2020)]